MYNVGDLIIYGNNGVCKVKEIGMIDMMAIDNNKLYYTLSPIYREEKIYVPIDTTVFSRPIITYERAQQIINIIPSIKENICEDWHPRALENHYNRLLESHECEDLIKIIKSIYLKNKNIKKKGKTPGQTDGKFMKKAEELLHGEFAAALGISKENVKSYIESRLIELEESSVIV